MRFCLASSTAFSTGSDSNSCTSLLSVRASSFCDVGRSEISDSELSARISNSAVARYCADCVTDRSSDAPIAKTMTAPTTFHRRPSTAR